MLPLESPAVAVWLSSPLHRLNKQTNRAELCLYILQTRYPSSSSSSSHHPAQRVAITQQGV